MLFANGSTIASISPKTRTFLDLPPQNLFAVCGFASVVAGCGSINRVNSR